VQESSEESKALLKGFAAKREGLDRITQKNRGKMTLVRLGGDKKGGKRNNPGRKRDRFDVERK